MIAQVEHRATAIDGGISHRWFTRGQCESQCDAYDESNGVSGSNGQLRKHAITASELGLNNYSQSHTAGALRIDGRQRCLKVYSHIARAPVFIFLCDTFVKCNIKRLIKKKWCKQKTRHITKQCRSHTLAINEVPSYILVYFFPVKFGNDIWRTKVDFFSVFIDALMCTNEYGIWSIKLENCSQNWNARSA